MKMGKQKIVAALRLVVALLFLLLIVGGAFFSWQSGCGILGCGSCAQQLRELAVDNYPWSAVMYELLFIAALAISIPASAILSTLGGFLFGWLPAVVLATVAVTLGSIVSFGLVRLLWGRALQRWYAPQFARFNAAIERDGARYLLASRLSLVFPFFLINILAGLTKLPLATFAWTTAIGSIPSVAIYALAGQQLYTIKSPSDFFTLPVMAVFFLLVLLILAPTIWRYVRRWRGR